MLLKIGRLGPLKESTIEFGDLTLLMGPPNTGKSYTLKALYAKLFPLDEYTSSIFEKSLSSSLKERYLDGVFPRESLSTLGELSGLMAELVVALPLLVEADSSDKIESVLRRIIEKRDFEPRVEISGSAVSITVRTKPISLKLDLDTLGQILRSASYTLAADLLPTEDFDSVILEPVDISKVAAGRIIGLLRYKPPESSTPSIHIGRMLFRLLEEIFTLYYEKYESNLELRRLARTYVYIIERALFPGFKGITAEIKPEMEISSSQDGLELTIVPVLLFRFDASTLRGYLKEVTPKEAVKEVIDKLAKLMASESRLRATIMRRTNAIKDVMLEECSDVISEELYKALREYVMSEADLDSLRFIPFGRSTILMEVESSSRDLFYQARYLSQLSELYPVVLASYAHWVSRGRGLFIDGRFTEGQKKLVKAATPLLEGALIADASRRLLLYRDWRGSIVEMRMASALVGEVSGILLPLLTVGRRPLILVEEPEAQLHPRAQIIMALFVAALPKLCNCRVVASTHSDLFAVTIAQLAVQKPEKEWIAELVRDLVPHAGEGVDDLAEAAAESARSIDVRVYEHTEEGSVKQIRLDSILSERVPGISEVVDELISWASRLAAHRLPEGGQ